MRPLQQHHIQGGVSSGVPAPPLVGANGGAVRAGVGGAWAVNYTCELGKRETTCQNALDEQTATVRDSRGTMDGTLKFPVFRLV